MHPVHRLVQSVQEILLTGPRGLAGSQARLRFRQAAGWTTCAEKSAVAGPSLRIVRARRQAAGSVLRLLHEAAGALF